MTYTKEDFARVQAEPCLCKPCGECNGTGNIWLAIGVKHPGNYYAEGLDRAEQRRLARDITRMIQDGIVIETWDTESVRAANWGHRCQQFGRPVSGASGPKARAAGEAKTK